MTEGEKYIKEGFITELSYDEAIKQAYKELNEMNIFNTYDIYDRDDIFYSPIYPANAELYDEFTDEYGFMLEEFYSFVCRYMNA